MLAKMLAKRYFSCSYCPISYTYNTGAKCRHTCVKQTFSTTSCRHVYLTTLQNKCWSLLWQCLCLHHCPSKATQRAIEPRKKIHRGQNRGAGRLWQLYFCCFLIAPWQWSCPCHLYCRWCKWAFICCCWRLWTCSQSPIAIHVCMERWLKQKCCF